MSDGLSLATTLRTQLGGSLRREHVGARVKLGGWVQRQRALGGIVFLDLRDRAGVVQVSFDPKFADAEAIKLAGSVGRESVVLIEGEVVARPENGRNPELATGEVEVKAVSMRVVGPAETPAIPVTLGKGETLPSEELRLRHRYLDLRRPELQANIVLRHRLMQATRSYLSERGFLEIETPILTKPTPEGARDYLVPSRVSAGEFYALPQSPQLYKQLLMISGFDRYFQIARCFRDEDLRADRQPEFTQIDIEASFIAAEDIYALAEGLIASLWKEAGVSIPIPFPRMKYADAVERYGTDRPDLRYGLEVFDATEIFRSVDFGITRGAIESGGRVRGIRIPGGVALSRKQVDELETLAKGAGAAGMLRLKREKGELSGPAAKFLSTEQAAALGIAEGDLCLLVAAADRISSPALDRVRQEVAKVMQLVPANTLSFLWVLDFPLFEKDATTNALGAVHHPFTSPHPEDLALLDSAPEKARALAYDVVLNGTELGGGSIRIADPEVQRRMFNLLAIDDETAQQRFGFLLEGLRSGAPPHGGIAFGFDRIAMLLSGATSLRDVIAFPKTTAARALFEGAPTAVAEEDLRDLHIRLAVEGAR
ncbi:MAG TPA: aspartate--tRNA ligase [Gemmatimonadaceae bacterium]|nr:aspartate--tRNA ligase [Gemmatimonadaceae bacterium]